MPYRARSMPGREGRKAHHLGTTPDAAAQRVGVVLPPAGERLKRFRRYRDHRISLTTVKIKGSLERR
jgi:hypothetical protein